MSDVDALLTAAAADPDAKAWIDLHEVACQEGFHDPQARRVLARLAESAAGFAPAHRDWPLIVAGQVAGDLPPSSRPGCAGPLAALRALAVEWLATPVEPRLFVDRLQALLALEGDDLWGAELERINQDAVEIECPGCEGMLFVVFGEDGGFATHEDYAVRGEVARTVLRPVAPGALRGVGRRLYELSAKAGHASVVTAVTYLFGEATCTVCGTEFRVADQVDRY